MGIGRKLSLHRAISTVSIHPTQSRDGFVRAVVEGPERIKRGGAKQFPDFLVHSGQHELAAAILDHQMAAQQERDECRTEVIDLGQVHDDLARRVLLEGSEHHLRCWLEQRFGEMFDLRRWDDHGDIAVPTHLEELVGQVRVGSHDSAFRNSRDGIWRTDNPSVFGAMGRIKQPEISPREKAPYVKVSKSGIDSPFRHAHYIAVVLPLLCSGPTIRRRKSRDGGVFRSLLTSRVEWPELALVPSARLAYSPPAFVVHLPARITMSSEHRPDFLARRVAGLVVWVARHPRMILGGALVLTIAAVHVAYAKLEYRTQRNDLISPDKPCQQRWQHYLNTFGDEDDMVVVAEGNDPERMKATLEAVAAKIAERPDLFDRVFYKVDLRPLRDRALLHVPLDQIEAIRARLGRMEPLLGPTSPLGWRMLSVQSLLSSAEGALTARAAGRAAVPSRPRLARPTSSSVNERGKHPPRSGSLQQSVGTGVGERATRTKGRAGETAVLLYARRRTRAPHLPPQEDHPVLRPSEGSQRRDAGHPGAGRTAIPGRETRPDRLARPGNRRDGALGYGFDTGIVAGAPGCRNSLLRRLSRLPLSTVDDRHARGRNALGIGWATITVGHLNILSATFAVMLIGLGDYGVLWVAQYDEARRRGESVEEALRLTAEHAGPSIVTAAATTGLAFFAIMLADFKAVAELGWIAGSGMLLCAASCILLMPAMLVLVERRKPVANPIPAEEGESAEPSATLPFPSAWLPGLAHRPRLALAIGAALLLGFGAFSFRLAYDHNLLNLQDHELDSVKWEHTLIDRAAGATWNALSITHSREEALALRERYESLPEVGKVVEVASLLPSDQDRKLPIIRAIHDKLAGLPPREKLPMPMGSSPTMVGKLASRVASLAPSDNALAQSSVRLAIAIEQLPDAGEKLRQFDRRLAADLAAELHLLKDVSRPARVTLDDVPHELRKRYVGANGEYLVRAFARDSLWDFPALQQFTAAANAVDPEATGKSFRTLEGLRQMKVGFEHAALYALVAITIVLLLDLRRFADLLLGLFPLAVGVVLTLGVMGLCGVSLNPANMIALPLIVGVGIDNGVHVLHDYRSRPPGVAYRLGAATGRERSRRGPDHGAGIRDAHHGTPCPAWQAWGWL